MYHQTVPTCRRIVTVVVAVLTTLAVAGRSQADHWPHWRGDQGNGVSLTAKPPTKWSATDNVKWKVEIPGRGSGSPVVWGNQVFVVTASREAAGGGGRRNVPKLAFVLMSFNRQTGQLQWKRTATVATPHQGTHRTNGFASASPCTDGEHVYAHFGSRGLYCYTMEGDLVWSRDDLGKMNTRNSFGEGSSPTLAGDKILVPWDHEGPSALFALDKRTGKTVWKTDRDEPTNWSTPLVVPNGDQMQVVVNGQNYARAYDLETGEELWRCSGQTQRPCASAVSANGIVYVGSGFRGYYLGAFRLTGKGDITRTDNVVWSVSENTPDIASPLLSRGRLYYYKAKTGLLTCVDAATGKPYYEAARVPGLTTIYASPIAAGGHVYLTDRRGTTTVINDANTLEVVASNSVGETVDATPAPVDNQLFIRGERHLFCIEE